MTGAQSIKAAALEYAAAGFQVFRLAPGGKTPLKGSNGYKDATTDLGQIEAWWTEKPDCNIGFAVGNGIIAIDLDVNHGKSTADGISIYEEFIKEHGEFLFRYSIAKIAEKLFVLMKQ